MVTRYLDEPQKEVENMSKYTDEEIRSIPKITCKIAADYLGVSPMAISIGMRNDLLPIGFSIKNEDRYSDSWSYHIIDERLIAYKHGHRSKYSLFPQRRSPSFLFVHRGLFDGIHTRRCA